MKLVNGIKVVKFKKTFTLPFDFEIPNSTREILKTKSLPSSRIKFIKRYLYLALKRQTSLEIYNILPDHRNILWINISAPSLGDTLMDLSSRTLLPGRKIDLFTVKSNFNIYKNDPYFSEVHYKFSQVTPKKYDLVILDSYSTRSVYIKTQIDCLAPFVGMFGFYNGPEVNRVLYSFHQMNNLLGYQYNDKEINKLSKPSIYISKGDKEFIKRQKLPSEFIAIVIGGEWCFRTFNNWDLVIQELIKLNNSIKIILIGSGNGIKTANLIIDKFSNNNVLSYVSKFTFNQTAELIYQAKFIVCCDGGLMHAAHSVGTTSVSLLARLDSDMQLTEAINSFPIFDDLDVNNISIESIVSRCREAANFADSHLLGG